MRTARRHDEKHLAFIRRLPCCRCGNNIETEAAHLRRSDARIGFKNPGVGRKPDDFLVTPLCSRCHRVQHETGEDNFWKGYDPLLVALALYAVSGDQEAGERIVQAAFRPVNILSAG